MAAAPNRPTPPTRPLSDAVNNIGDVGKSVVAKSLNLGPKITVDQGTSITVFVNQDLVFPAGTLGNAPLLP